VRIDVATAELRLGYHESEWPLTPPTFAAMLENVPDLDALGRACRDATAQDARAFSREMQRVLGDRLAREALEAAVARLNTDVRRLHELHEAQVWRLAHWRLGREELTHRRFFEISELVGVRVEDDAVFADVHALTARLVREGSVDGLRIDHIDGLADPGFYLSRLHRETGIDYVLVEKILGPNEELRSDWRTAGATGYEVARMITGLQVDPANEQMMTQAWTDFTGDDPSFAEQAARIKRRILTVNLAAELKALVSHALKIAQAGLTTRDFGQDALRRAIVEIAVALPVYRTYVDDEGPSEADRALIRTAVELANRGREIEDDREPDFIGSLLLKVDPATEERDAFVRRFQQTTGALTAKAIEDTTFYRFNRLLALNEVGSEPDAFGLSPAAFHETMVRRARSWPYALSSTATHDTKRGEDSRARLTVLSEMPREWAAAMRRWHDATQDLHEYLPLGPAPGSSAIWLFYQALAGAWPSDLSPDDPEGVGLLAERLDAFMTKALREAKRRTSWTNQNEDYEAAVSRYVHGVLSPLRKALLDDISGTLRPIIAAGMLNSLTQTALKLTAPGVPDIYQGCELLDLSLVDPDNRRPVDFELRNDLLKEASGMTAPETMARWRDGLPKLWLVHRLLDLRRRRPRPFLDGSYAPLTVEGHDADHLIAFARQFGDETIVTVAPRLLLGRLSVDDPPGLDPRAFADTRIHLPTKHVRLLDGRTVRNGEGGIAVMDLLGGFPVSVMESIA
jgi:(1->4)-alpha-D-glucan 1-alpha-D-glucosylmutase